mgnify:FL=1
MDKRTVEQIKDFLNSICSKNNFSLVDVEVTDTSSELKLVVFIDKDGGVFIDDCIKFNDLINATQTLDELVPSSYILEVSSPGPKRPLKNLSDFVRYKGKKVRVKLSKKLEESLKNVLVGEIEKVEGSKISINDSGKCFIFDFSNILKANLNL